nr:MAG TPA: hypothetical protein [Caudoviricetes sp.]
MTSSRATRRLWPISGRCTGLTCTARTGWLS